VTIRRVEIHVIADDEVAKQELRDLKKLEDDIERPRKIRFSVDVGDQMKLDRLKLSLDELGKKVATPTVRVDGIAASLASVTLLNRELDKLNGKTVSTSVRANTDRLSQDFTNALRDMISSHSGVQTVDVRHTLAEKLGFMRDLLPHTLGNKLFRLFQLHRMGEILGTEKGLLHAFSVHMRGGGGGGGSDIGGAGSAAGGGISGLAAMFGALPSQARGIGIGALIAAAASTGAGLIPLGLGGLIGAGGLYGAYKLDPKAFAAVKKDLSSAFLSALTSKPQGIESGFGHTGPMGPFGTGGESFLQGVKGILHQIAGFIKTIGPDLGGMFRASLPILMMFTKSMETLAKIVMPAFTQSMAALKPDLPYFQQGFKFLAQGIAGFMKQLGPGMKDSAIIFKGLMDGVKYVLIGLGWAFSHLSIYIVKWVEKAKVDFHIFAGWFDWLRHRVAERMDEWRQGWDVFRHETAVIWDGIRHDIAHIWDMTWNNTIGRMIRGQQDVFRLGNEGRHEISNIFDGIRHDIAHWWDIAWQDTVGRVERGVSTVSNWFHRMGTDIWNEVRHLPGILWKEGRMMLSELWNGVKSVYHGFMSFWQGIGHSVLHVFDVITGRHSPSKEMFARGVDLMLGLEHGIRSRLGSIQMISGHVGGSVVSWIHQAMSGAHAPASWFPALERLVSLESGGNPRAVNPTAIAGGQHATGLWQMLPSTYASYAWGLPPNDLTNPIIEGIAALRYIMSNYGSPYNIPGLMSGGYRGYWSGGWVNEPVVGFGMHSGAAYSFAEHGREYVSPGGSGGDVYNIYTFDPSYSDAKAISQIQTLQRYRKRHGDVPLGLG
jgi:hypothetical protein